MKPHHNAAPAARMDDSLPIDDVNRAVDYSGLDYVDVPEHLLCPICQCPFVNPYTTKCGHTFCKECLMQALEPDPNLSVECRCPIDRQPLNRDYVEDIFPAPKIISNMVNDLVAVCPNKSRGCPFQDQRWLLQRHLKDTCDYALVPCGGIKEDGTICREPTYRRFIMDERRIQRDHLLYGYSMVPPTDNSRLPPLTLDNKTTSDSLSVVSHVDDIQTGRAPRGDATQAIEQPNDPNTTRVSENNNVYLNAVKNTRIYQKLSSQEDIPLSELNDEIQIPCVHQEIDCANGCGVKITKTTKEIHNNTGCTKVMVSCDYCQLVVAKPKLNSHHDICPQMTISCLASIYGCSWVGKRQDLKIDHYHKCHFIAMEPFLSRQEKKIEMLEKENKSLRYHLNDVSQSLANLPNAHRNDSVSSSSTAYSGESIESVLSVSSSVQTPDLSVTNSTVLHILMENERLRADIEHLTTSLGELEMKQSTLLMQENFRNQEVIHSMKGMINTLRQQLHYLLLEHRAFTANSSNPVNITNQSSKLASTRPDLLGPRLSDITRQDVKL